jgi:hypothetical protein
MTDQKNPALKPIRPLKITAETLELYLQEFFETRKEFLVLARGS